MNSLNRSAAKHFRVLRGWICFNMSLCEIFGMLNMLSHCWGHLNTPLDNTSTNNQHVESLSSGQIQCICTRLYFFCHLHGKVINSKAFSSLRPFSRFLKRLYFISHFFYILSILDLHWKIMESILPLFVLTTLGGKYQNQTKSPYFRTLMQHKKGSLIFFS